MLQTSISLRAGLATALGLALFGCDGDERPSESVPQSAAPVEAPPSEASAEVSPAKSVHDELASMDHRTPVPLQPMMAWHQKQNMMGHLEAIQRITQAVADEDWTEIGAAAATIATSPQMKNMCEHMGAGAPGFTEMALDFHARADAIAPAAEAHDGAAVLRATSNTLKACTGCHATYRQEVVDAETWQARTGSAHDPSSAWGK